MLAPGDAGAAGLDTADSEGASGECDRLGAGARVPAWAELPALYASNGQRLMAQSFSSSSARRGLPRVSPSERPHSTAPKLLAPRQRLTKGAAIAGDDDSAAVTIIPPLRTRPYRFSLQPNHRHRHRHSAARRCRRHARGPAPRRARPARGRQPRR
eukprot:scaffold1845_cov291-Prasinococcus_capsulatus_cf.AAC.3